MSSSRSRSQARGATLEDEVGLDVEPEEAGLRLDVLLVQRLEGVSRASARRLIQDGCVRVDGRLARKGARLNPGERVVLERMPAPRDFPALPSTELGLVVLYEDDELVVVDKPAGLPTHPLRPDEDRTLAGALVARFPEMAGVGYAQREPGILHRLDNDTSGVLLAARSQRMFDALRAQLSAGDIDKRYLALVMGELRAELTIDFPIANHPGDPRRVHACVDPADRRLPASRPAHTEVLTSRAVGDCTLVELRACVATRHQIRAHLAALGHPLVGDWLYGGPTDALERHFLHASAIGLRHPLFDRRLHIESALPPELAALVG